MSSSNRVRVTFIEETTYGETPVAGNFQTARFTSESLSGTPETTESEQIRTDRLSSGQVVTGLTVGGDINFEMAKETQLEEFLESAFYSTWASSAPVAVDVDLDTSAKTLTRASGSFITDGFSVGDVITATGFSNTENNTQYLITDVTALVLSVTIPEGAVTEVGSGTSLQVADKISIGTTKKSFSMEKKFEDLTDKGINYRGMIVSNLSLNVSYGEIVTGTLSFQGNDYEPWSVAANAITDGRTVDAAATSNSMNGSVDMPFLISGATGTLQEADFCIQSIETSMDNGLTAQTCIGKAAPTDYTEGQASIEQSITAYLSDSSWSLLSKKLSQESFEIGYLIKNVDGYYGFYLPAVQVSFEDPASPGANQDVLLNMTGTAKVGANGESSLTMYRS